ncbi:MAG TPA: T9SS type A sorting domain-containing protein, partial [Saprospiraceae bacterium]|nr:T9SS type A sorting domain-containing protein [Saprospiraceae bacterium]
TYTFELDIVTAVTEPDQEAAVRVFPNPSTGQVTIHFTRSLNERLQVDLFTPEGKNVLSRVISKEQAKLDLQDLPGGQYIIELRTGRKFFVTKLMLLQ